MFLLLLRFPASLPGTMAEDGRLFPLLLLCLAGADLDEDDFQDWRDELL